MKWALCLAGSAALAAIPAPSGPPAARAADVLATPAQHSTLAASRLLNGVARAGDRVVAAGQRGHIVVSRDGGSSWKQAKVPVSSDLAAVHFPTPRLGWAVGHDGVVLHSSDGGDTWVKQLDGNAAAELLLEHCEALARDGKPETRKLAEEAKQAAAQGADKPFLDVWFEDASTGYIVGAFNFIFRTVDAGRTWEPLYERTDNPSRLHLYAVRGAPGADLYVAGEQGLVMRLDREAGRFVALPIEYKGSFFGIAVKPSVQVAHGLRGNAFRSTDGGKSWHKVATGVGSSITGSTVLDDGRIVLVTQAGHILASADQGASFTALEPARPMSYSAVAAAGGALVLVGLQGAQAQSPPGERNPP